MNTQKNGHEVLIYRNWGKDLLLLVGCVVLFIFCKSILVDAIEAYSGSTTSTDGSSAIVDLITGSIGTLFFGAGGIVYLFSLHRLGGRPAIKIYDDRIEWFEWGIRHWGKHMDYTTIRFEDVEDFRITIIKNSIRSPSFSFISIDHKSGALPATEVKTLPQKMSKIMDKINAWYVGSSVNIPADNLSMKPQALYDLMKERLEHHREQNKGG